MPDPRQIRRFGVIVGCAAVLAAAGPEGTRSLALDNGFIRRSFTPCNVSVLPGDFLVFELNHEDGHTPRGIYVVSLRENRIARLGAGRSPVAVYEAGVEGWVPPKER